MSRTYILKDGRDQLTHQLAQAQAQCDKNFQLAATAQDQAKRLEAQLTEAKYELALSNKIRDETLQRLNECDAEIAGLKSELARHRKGGSV